MSKRAAAETWVLIEEGPLEPGDPGPIEMVTVHHDWFGRRSETPSLVREDCWVNGRYKPRWWKKVPA